MRSALRQQGEVKLICPECGADVSALREFCPKCGTPTDPTFRERRARGAGPRPGEELKSNRKTILVAAAALLGVAAVSNAVFDPDFFDSDEQATIPSRPEARGAVVIDAEQLYQAYRDDEEAADRRFDGREMVISGEFLRIVPDGYGSLDLRLKTSNPEIPVGIDLAELALEDGKRLRPGQQVTVSCKGMGGSGNELWVRDCAVQNGQQDPAVPEPPAAPEPSAAPESPTAPEAPTAPVAPERDDS